MELLITVKTEHVGAVMGDMSKRRGRILGQEEIGNGKTVVTAEVPESEISKYATELKTMTQASGRFERRFLRYDITPEDQIKKIVAEYKTARFSRILSFKTTLPLTIAFIDLPSVPY